MSERWLTYDEMTALMGLTKGSAKVLTRTKRWPRRPGNDGRARIGVPEEEILARREGERARASPLRSPPPRPPQNPPRSPPGRPGGNDGEENPRDLTKETIELRVLCARLEAQLEALRAAALEKDELAQRERISLQARVEEMAAERDRWAAQAEALARRPRFAWPWSRRA